MLPAFADAGPEGVKLQDDMVRIATQSGMALCGPNTNGVMSLLGNAYLCGFVPHEGAKRGGVAICTQSGSLANMLSRDTASLGLAYVVSSGNEATLTTAEYLDAFVRGRRRQGDPADAREAVRRRWAATCGGCARLLPPKARP